MTEVNLIEELPSALSCVVIGDWLDLASVVRLDSALCNHSLRAKLKELFHSNECVFNDRWCLAQDVSEAFSWIEDRGLKVSHCFIVSAVRPDIFMAFLQNNPQICSLTLLTSCYTTNPLMNVVAELCNRLTYLSCPVVNDVSVLINVLHANPHLKELELVLNYSCPGNLAHQQWSEVQLTNLRNLRVDCACSKCILAIVKGTTNLQRLQHTGNGRSIGKADLIDTVQNCPSLRTLAWQNAHVAWDGDLGRACAICRHIMHLDLFGCRTVTDHEIHSVAKTLDNLRSICLVGCIKVTDASLQYLAEYNSTTLETFYVGNGGHKESSVVSQQAVLFLINACGKLTIVRWVERLTFEQSYSSASYHKYENATTIRILYGSDAMLQKLTHYCGKLTVLDLRELPVASLRGLTSEQLVQFMSKCSALPAVIVNKKSKGLFETLRSACPHLHVTYDASFYTYDVMKMPI